MREEALQHDLHKTRMALIKQVCHNCNHNDADKPEDTVSITFFALKHTCFTKQIENVEENII